MSDPNRTMQDVLQERIVTIQKISEATAEHLRLMQRQGGIQVLNLVDGEDAQNANDLDRTEEALDGCEATIASLERRLGELDREIEAMADGGPV